MFLLHLYGSKLPRDLLGKRLLKPTFLLNAYPYCSTKYLNLALFSIKIFSTFVDIFELTFLRPIDSLSRNLGKG